MTGAGSCETFNAARMAAAGLCHALGAGQSFDVRQARHPARVALPTPPHAQDKLVRCTRGAIFDVAVDIRARLAHLWQMGRRRTDARERPPIAGAQGLSARLCHPRCRIPRCSTNARDVYAPDCDGGIRWDDPDIGIDWGITDPTLSAKDAVAPFLHDFASPFDMERRMKLLVTGGRGLHRLGGRAAGRGARA